MVTTGVRVEDYQNVEGPGDSGVVEGRATGDSGQITSRACGRSHAADQRIIPRARVFRSLCQRIEFQSALRNDKIGTTEARFPCQPASYNLSFRPE